MRVYIDFFARRISVRSENITLAQPGCFIASDNDHYPQMYCEHAAQTSMASHQVNMHPAESDKQEPNSAPMTDTICGPLCLTQMILIVGFLK